MFTLPKYSITNDTQSGSVLGRKLQDEINADTSVDVNVHHIDTVGDDIFITMESEPSESTINAITALVNAHTSLTAFESVQNVIENAMSFGRQLMKEYAASNVIAGYNTAQVKAISNHLENVQRYIDSGSLYVALDEINSLSPLTVDSVELISQAKLDEFSQKIMDYLGI